MSLDKLCTQCTLSQKTAHFLYQSLDDLPLNYSPLGFKCIGALKQLILLIYMYVSVFQNVKQPGPVGRPRIQNTWVLSQMVKLVTYMQFFWVGRALRRKVMGRLFPSPSDSGVQGASPSVFVNFLGVKMQVKMMLLLLTTFDFLSIQNCIFVATIFNHVELSSSLKHYTVSFRDVTIIQSQLHETLTQYETVRFCVSTLKYSISFASPNVSHFKFHSFKNLEKS